VGDVKGAIRYMGKAGLRKETTEETLLCCLPIGHGNRDKIYSLWPTMSRKLDSH
jgi:hypothetical protein